ncbi:MAG: sarcosine oxidase subunit gamma [Gammaproteobacteria bacterium]|nr:MAG: sarcosine oxidase subunit gamma [Gammaproteobacteria bacterium]PIE38391.1 MAG: sarcosine oxidase subunit gamma [Gammaproteobacteria bacterium]
MSTASLTPVSVWQSLARSTAGASPGDGAGVQFTPLGAHGLLVLRARDEVRDALAAGLRSVCELDLPDKLQSVARGEYCLRWISPDEWWLSLPFDAADSTLAKLRDAIDASVALVDLSSGYEFMRLEGSKAREVLMKSVPYPVDAAHLPPGKVVSTMLSKSQLCLRALDDDAFELIVRRSFADYVWHWLVDAAGEYGWQTT